tara:strand:- start:147 stop:323 length:177 start_codon:yes stop_codon:yes gene_type:complete
MEQVKEKKFTRGKSLSKIDLNASALDTKDNPPQKISNGAQVEESKSPHNNCLKYIVQN